MSLVKWLLMETATNATQTPRELPIVGGHLALDFANTVDDPDGPKRYDHAGTYPELVEWSVRIGVLMPDQADALLAAADEHPLVSSIAVRRAHSLRRILIETYTDIAVINSGATAGTERLRPVAHWDELRPYVTDAMAHAGRFDVSADLARDDEAGRDASADWSGGTRATHQSAAVPAQEVRWLSMGVS